MVNPKECEHKISEVWRREITTPANLLVPMGHHWMSMCPECGAVAVNQDNAHLMFLKREDLLRALGFEGVR